jgi:CopG family nickel-responsive transcriptional regulator
MSRIVRSSFAMEEELTRQMEALVKKSRYTNRSEFIRDLVREKLAQKTWEGQGDALGTITLIYDHGKRELSQRITHLQHHHVGEVLAATHVHLTEHLCAEMIMVKGRASSIQALADALRSQKGVYQATLSMAGIVKTTHPRTTHTHAGHTHPHTH